MSGLVDILERHPHLGKEWGEKMDAHLRDMRDALDELEEP
jgi:hypothetical protein